MKVRSTPSARSQFLAGLEYVSVAPFWPYRLFLPRSPRACGGWHGAQLLASPETGRRHAHPQC